MELAAGLTVIVGANGLGKTNLVEAIGLLATLKSFRGAPPDALVRVGAERAIVRADVRVGDRPMQMEIELPRGGRARALVNRQKVTRTRDLLGSVNVTVFSPDDLEMVKGGPSGRRDLLDDLLVAVHPKNVAVVDEFERVLKQRNALLRQSGGRLDDASTLTLDVWDERVAECGTRLAALRSKITSELVPRVTTAYQCIAGVDATVELAYASCWSGALLDALRSSRSDDVRRGVSTVGPHRDDLEIHLNHMTTRTHASQGEQRSMVLALRLAAHDVVTTATGSVPVLILDDVLSELDDGRVGALLGSLPPGQTVITTASAVPTQVDPERVLEL